MKNLDKVTANYVKRYTKKKVKCLFAQIEDPDDSATCPSSKCKFCEKQNRQMGAGIRKQKVTIAMMLAILLSSVTKIHLQGPANPNMLLRVLERFLLVLINHYVHHLHLALSQASTFSQPLKR